MAPTNAVSKKIEQKTRTKRNAVVGQDLQRNVHDLLDVGSSSLGLEEEQKLNRNQSTFVINTQKQNGSDAFGLESDLDRSGSLGTKAKKSQ